MRKVLLLGALLWAVGGAWAETPHHLWSAMEQAFNAQSWTETAELGTRFLESYPDDPQAGPACFLRGMALLRSGYPEQALGSFQKASRLVSSGPLKQRLPFWEGYAAYQAGQYSTAVAAWERQIKLAPDSELTAQAWFYLGLARQKLGESSAVQAWTKFLDQPRASQLKPQALIRLGDFLVKQQPEKAQKAWERLIRDYPHSALAPDAALRLAPLLASKNPDQESSLLEQVWKNHPSRASELLPVLIDIEQRQNQWSRAAHFVRAYLEGELPASVRQKAWSDLAWLQTQLHEDSALSWSKAAQGPDEELAARAELSWALAKEASGQKATAAQESYQWALDHSRAPTETLLWNSVRLWREQERWEHAQSALKLLLRRYPNSSQVPTYLLEDAKLAQQLGNSSQVLKICQQLGTNYAPTPEAHEALYLMGMVYLNRGEPLRAEGYFYTLMERLGNGQTSQNANPEQKDLYWRALLARGMAFLDGGKNDLAQASLKRLINESPEGPWTGAAWSALGAVLFREARYEEASEAYAQAVAHLKLPGQLPDQEKAAWYQAQSLSTGQLWVKAVPAYASFVKTYPESSHRQEALFLEGLCLVRQGKPQQALAVWTPQLTRRSRSLPADWWEEAAAADLQLGHTTQAWQRLEQMADVYHNTPEVVAALLNRWAQTAQSLGKAEEAAKAYS
ncbi:MAG: tetratricopeptide repeat protein, partial [Spirochaetales bacterium]|nr:tetratricopeptide repeat protein [Spirochaetales bacterium]